MLAQVLAGAEPQDLINSGIDLVKSGNYRALAALVIFVVVKFGSPLLARKYPFFATSKGKALSVLAIALATGVFTAMLPGHAPSVSMLWDAVNNALAAAGGFSLLKPFMPESTKLT